MHAGIFQHHAERRLQGGGFLLSRSFAGGPVSGDALGGGGGAPTSSKAEHSGRGWGGGGGTRLEIAQQTSPNNETRGVFAAGT